MPLCSLEEALEDLSSGKFVIVVDDENRENEGDLFLFAEHATPASVNFMVTHARGLVCVPMSGERLDELRIPLLRSRNSSSPQPTAFTTSVDYKIGTSTGISAHDRCATIRALIDPETARDSYTRAISSRCGPILAASSGDPDTPKPSWT